MSPNIVVLSSWYFAAQVLVAWFFRPQYSFVSNAIGDLGNTACPPPHSNICSPLHVWMNVSFVILGLAMIVGAILIFSEFGSSADLRELAAALAGFVCMGLGGVGAILVGAVPENVNTAHLHTVGMAMAIGFGQLAILILGLVLREIPDWLRKFMIVTSLFVLLAGISLAGKHQFGIGEGALERLAQYPESVWLILFGLYISRNHHRIAATGSHSRFSGERPPRDATLRWALGESVKSLAPRAFRITSAPEFAGSLISVAVAWAIGFVAFSGSSYWFQTTVLIVLTLLTIQGVLRSHFYRQWIFWRPPNYPGISAVYNALFAFVTLSAFCALVSAEFYRFGLFRVAEARPTGNLLWMYTVTYFWNLVDAIPWLQITGTLHWDSPLHFSNTWGELFIILFRLLALGPLLAVFARAFQEGGKAAKSRTDEPAPPPAAEPETADNRA
jgi:hypothetical membrane protein